MRRTSRAELGYEKEGSHSSLWLVLTGMTVVTRDLLCISFRYLFYQFCSTFRVSKGFRVAGELRSGNLSVCQTRIDLMRRLYIYKLLVIAGSFISCDISLESKRESVMIKVCT